MNGKIIIIFFMAIFATKALPSEFPAQLASIQVKLESLSLWYSDLIDYNSYILNLEAVIEESQQVALGTIQTTVELGQEFTKIIDTIGTQQNLLIINNIQSTLFKLLEDTRRKAFEKEIDISTCVHDTIKKVHTDSQSALTDIRDKLDSISVLFENITTTKYITPANSSLLTSYTIRERIYLCPFNSDDFTPFYLCLAVTAVLDDIVLLSNFVTTYNDTEDQVTELLTEYQEAATYFQEDNTNDFNSTAMTAYNNDFLSCAASKGYTA